MKYDRPVWQIMHACADGMPDVFRYEDVREWFRLNYPDVNEATIRAHLIGLTDGGRAKHVQFAQRSPVFRRVARGEYEPIPLAERGETPDAETPSGSKLKMTPEPTAAKTNGEAIKNGTLSSKSTFSKLTKPAGQAESGPAEAEPSVGDPAPRVPDIVLLGSVGDRVNVPAPAKEVFREVAFQLSRLDAEVSGSEWFILSAEHGLVAPNEWMSPDSRTLAEMDPDYRVTWASWVVARLQSLVGSIAGLHVRVDAPDAFIGPLFADLQEAGAVVSSGNVGVTVPPLTRVTRAVTPVADRMDPADVLVEAVRTVVGGEPLVVELARVPEVAQAAEVAEVVHISPLSPASVHLADQRHAVSAACIADLPESPGLYGWFVDPIGARELNRCLMLPVRSGLIFVGQVGGSSWKALPDPVLNLRDHVDRIQLHGRARASTFRMTLATVLRDYLRMTTLEDSRLTDWMMEHLSVSVLATDEFSNLCELERVVIRELHPPLNVDNPPAAEYRARLSQMRSATA